MDLTGGSAVITGGASGLGLATAKALIRREVPVVIIDLPTSAGEAVSKELGELAQFSPADVRDENAVSTALDLAEAVAPIRALIHCAGRGGNVRLVEKDGSPGSMELYTEIVTINLFGTFNVLRLTSARMAKNEPIEGERGVCILTASIAAYEGQIGQIPYASSKAGVVGMTIVAARDLSRRLIRVATIAPGIFDTPILNRLPDKVRTALEEGVPHPSRFGRPEEYAHLALAMIENQMLNGEVIRLDGASRMTPR
jgi:NAD(P)-dependent dehydrogenase (short-subunit alcohol dehydrogenase family)